MVKNVRWGHPYRDKRDWSVYNECLVKRGGFYLSLDFIEKWDALLNRMNQGKRGQPYRYPELFIEWMACVHIFLQLPYRQMEGFTRKLSGYIPGLRSADYTTLFRRISTLNLALNINSGRIADTVIIAIDSTGIKVTNRGEWMREKWKVHRGWIKVHAIIDVESNQFLGIEVTEENVTDEQMFKPLMQRTMENIPNSCIGQILGDGAYDRNQIFNFLEKNHIVSAIKTRANASRRSTGSPYRAQCVRYRDELGGYSPWAESVNYGNRWKVEGLFSAVKRIFGEYVHASSKTGMLREAALKFSCYNLLVNLA